MTRTLLNLPNEVIKLCLDSLDEVSDLTTSRLVCKKLDAICAPLLWRDGLDVTMTTRSLARLHFVSTKPVFAISIKKITFDLTYYDHVATMSYTDFCHESTRRIWSQLWSKLFWSYMESGSDNPWVNIFNIIRYKISDLWYDSELEKPDSKPGAVLTALHEKYCNLYNDQEVAIQQFTDIDNVASALQRLTNIRCVRITDKSTDPAWPLRKVESTIQERLNSVLAPVFNQAESWHSERYGIVAPQSIKEKLAKLETKLKGFIMDSCLHKFQFKDEWVPMQLGPSRMVPVLSNAFKALTKSLTFPASVELDITPHQDMRMLEITNEDMVYIRYATKKARTIDISVTSWNRIWMRRPPPMSNQRRPQSEWEHMERLIGALCNRRTKLQYLRINLHGHPTNGYDPEISAGEFLSLRWRDLRSLDLCSVPFEANHFVEMIENLPITLEKLHLNEIYLHRGTWAKAMRCLTDLRQVHDMYFRWPCGGEYGRRDYEEGVDNENLQLDLRPVIRYSRNPV